MQPFDNAKVQESANVCGEQLKPKIGLITPKIGNRKDLEMKEAEY